jgi:solute:Na+ symporter, SSS family
MNPVDVAVLILYFLGVSAAGVFFSWRNNTTEAYFLGNRNFPAWAIGLSLVGTSISSISFLAYPGDAYKTAWLRLLPAFVLPIAIIIASIWILPFFRSRNYTSAFEYLGLRFGSGARVYGALAFCIAQLMRIGFILFLVSLLIHEFTGWNQYVCAIIAGVFVSFYTIMGGFEAVVWTDVVQTIVLLLGGIVCLVIVVKELPGGLGMIIDQASEAGKFKLAEWDVENARPAETSWAFTLSKKTALMMLVVGFMNWMYEYCCNQNVVQRYCASRTTADARKAMWICCISSIPIWTFFMFLGTALWVYYTQFPTTETAQMLSGELKADQILPYFILNRLPMGIAGLVIAAVMAAAMSSLDSSINAISTVLITDIVKPHIAKDKDDAYYLKLAHKLAIGSSVIMIIGASIFLADKDSKTAQDTYNFLVALTAGGLFSLYFIGFATTIGDGRSIMIAIGFTFLFSLYRALEGTGIVPALPIDGYYTGIVGNVIMFVLGLIVGNVLPGKQKNLDDLTLWTKTEEA